MIQGAKYDPSISSNNILKGYGDSDFKENSPVKRIEFYAMLSRAFGKLPEPKGGMKLMMPDEVSYGSIPVWAEADIQNIVDARILTQADTLDGNISHNEAMLLIQRVHSLLGASIKDDFYAAVNNEYIENSVLMPGYPFENNFTYVQRKIDQDLRELVDNILAQPYQQNTPQQKIADVYKNYLNHDARDKEGLAPIQPYIDALGNVKTLDELTDTCFMISTELAYDIFADFEVTIDNKDSDRKIMEFRTYNPSQSRDFYTDETGEKKELYISYLETVLLKAGFDADYSKSAPLDFYDMEKDLSRLALEPQDYYDPQKTYNIYTFGELKAIIPHLDLDKLLNNYGYQMPDKIIVADVALCQEFGQLYTEENLERLKTAAIIRLLTTFAPLLGTDFENESDLFRQKIFGIDSNKPDDEKALYNVIILFSDYLAPIYIENYFTEKTKADVENMCREFIGEYKQRILDLSWMSDITKQQAIKKLDNIKLNIGYPDKYDTDAIDQAIIKNADESGSYFDNIVAINIEYRKQNVREQFLPADKSIWDFTPYEVNAFYDPTDNSINFPAGILQAPFYDKDAKKEANYGAIGVVIAHEITHAFDNNGALYDEHGNFNNWWTEEDYNAFLALQDNVINIYDGYEVFPGIQNDGTLTLSENIADLGGTACALSVLNKMDNPDYDAFFRNIALIWRSIGTRNILKYFAATDVHSLNKTRTNISLGVFEEFYQTYGITENDFLYIPPEKRANIW